MTRFIWTDVAKSELRNIEQNQALQILRALNDYSRTGEGDVKRLQGLHEWRLRVGDYRVRFELAPGNCLRIVHVKHRREVYR